MQIDERPASSSKMEDPGGTADPARRAAANQQEAASQSRIGVAFRDVIIGGGLVAEPGSGVSLPALGSDESVPVQKF